MSIVPRRTTRPTPPSFAFCEPVTATPTSRVHIRRLDGLPKFGGGAKGPTLCGREFRNGWDLGGQVTPAIVTVTLGRETGCAAVYLEETA